MDCGNNSLFNDMLLQVELYCTYRLICEPETYIMNS